MNEEQERAQASGEVKSEKTWKMIYGFGTNPLPVGAKVVHPMTLEEYCDMVAFIGVRAKVSITDAVSIASGFMYTRLMHTVDLVLPQE